MTVLEVKDKVQQMLTEIAGSVTIDSDGDFGIDHESARVFIRVAEWGDQTVIRVFSQFLRDVPLTPELYEWVATKGQDYLFGHTALIEQDNNIGRLDFGTYLLGDYLDFEELKAAVLCVVFTANDLDDELKAKFGGLRFRD